MKHFKIKLSVLALACLGAGALALQPTANAKAEHEGYGTSGIVMQDGAAVCLLDEFNGIRWTTTVDAEWYAGVFAACKEDKASALRFGVIVAPTGSFDGELTAQTEGALNLLSDGDNKFTADNEGKEDRTFYSVISYDKIWEEYEAAGGEMSEEAVLEKAYSMELTARAYMRYRLPNADGEGTTLYYEYADMVDSSRSARQVALAAEIAGDLDAYRESTDVNVQAKAQKGASYYGYGANAEDYYKGYEVNTGKVGTQYIDLSAVATAAQDYAVTDFAVAEGYTINEVFVGRKPIENYEYANNTLTLKLAAGQALPTGETYVFVYAKNAEGDVAVYTKPIIGATKVLKTTEDLKMFNAKGDNYDRTTKVGTESANIKEYWKPEQEQSGYYVLGNDIDATGYNHGSMNAADAYKEAGKYNNSTWNGAVTYENKPIGLTGTFNGMGYAIDRITMATQNEGFFGIVNGGTVKNVAFTNVFSAVTKSSYILANYLLNATIDNVYIATNEYDKNDATNNPGFVYAGTELSGVLANYAVLDTKISNVLITLGRGAKNVAVGTVYGALFGGTNKNESYTCENVFTYVRTLATYVTETTTVTDDVSKTVYSGTLTYYYLPMVGTQPSLQKDANKEYTIVKTKGTLYLAENQSLAGNRGKDDAVVNLSETAYDVVTIAGVYYYAQGAKWGAYDPAGFLASGCWKAKSGSRPAWGA